MNGNKGFTLIELAVVLAIIAVLAAILTPIVTSYIDQARDVRGRSDVETIARAALLYQRDTGRFPIYANTSADSADTQVADLLVTGGSTPNSSGGWASLSSATLADYLNINRLSLQTGAGSGQNLGATAFRGPYLDNAMQGDPWGNRYTLTATNLKRTVQSNWAYVISAGPDGTINTTYAQAKTAAFAVSGDDLVAFIR